MQLLASGLLEVLVAKEVLRKAVFHFCCEMNSSDLSTPVVCSICDHSMGIALRFHVVRPLVQDPGLFPALYIPLVLCANHFQNGSRIEEVVRLLWMRA